MADHVFGWLLICTFISVLFTVVTYVVSVETPWLKKNRQGSILRGYLASVIGYMFLLATLSLTMILFGEIPVSYLSVGLCIWYFGIASLFWFNVMCIDISAKFREFRYSMDHNVDGFRRPKFVDYAIYAWGSAAVHALLIIACMIIWNWNCTAMFYACFSMALFPIFGTMIWNVFLLISTALIIKKYDLEEAAYSIQCIDVCHEENKEWFTSCVKLFIVISISLTIALFCSDSIFDTIVPGLAALQGISIFMIFV